MDRYKISIIVPCKEVNNITKECISHCLELDYSCYEIIVLPDCVPKSNVQNVKIIPTGSVSPGAKRNIGVAASTSELCAFIDSDAYPKRDWLKNAVKHLNNDVVGVGGPGLTPQEDNIMQKASGYVISSFMAGNLSLRTRVHGVRISDDVPSCNLIVRKDMLNKIKGWNEKYWPGEDSLLSLSIRERGGKMIESDDVVVYHHRRSLFLPHMKQISRFAIHRGFFAKRFPQNSRRINFFLPSILLLYLLLGGAISLLVPAFRVIFASTISTYLLVTFVSALPAGSFKMIIFTFIGIVITHATYGAYFLVGLVKKNLLS